MDRAFVLTLVCGMALVACAPTLGVTEEGVPSPDTREPVTTNEVTILQTMRQWLEQFREKQREYYGFHGHFAEDVTVDGEIRQLPSPYATSYWAPQSLQGYEVTVRHEGTGRACRLAEGRFAHESDAGKILCND